MSGSVIKTFADERLLASNFGISFFPSYPFGVAVKGNSFVLEKYPRPRRSNFPFALLFCAITLPIQCTTHWSPFRGMSNAFCDFALVLFLAEITLYSAFHFKLSWFFILYSFCNCTLALRWSLFVQVLLSTDILFRSSDNNAWQLKTKLSRLL